MRNFIILAFVGASIAGAGERVIKRMHATATPAGQASAASATATSGKTAPGGPAQPNAGKLQLRADRDGHFRVSALVNGRQMNFMVDTGATVIALTRRDADRLGVDARGGTALIHTANGSTTATATRLKTVDIGDLSVRDVDAVVMPDGKLGENLLGMSFLSRLGRFEMRNGVLVLER